MKEDIFDSLIREKLSEAEVRAPKGVWAGVARRVGVDTPRRPWPAYAALAGVCAAVAVFLVVHPGHNPLEETERYALEVLPAVVNLEKSPEKPASLADLRAKAVVLPQQDGNVENGEDGDEEVPVSVQEKVSGGRKTVLPDDGDPFAALIAEDERLARALSRETVSFEFGGVIGANDSHFDGRASRPAWASGHAPEGVEQNSVSTFLVPVSMALSAVFPVNEKFSVGAGLSWTTLNRKFQGSFETAEGEFTHRLDYIGLSLGMYYNLVRRSSLRIYANLSGSVEKAVGSRYYIYSRSRNPLISEKVDGLQFGLRMGFGMSFPISEHISVYFDPYVGYYLPANQPVSLRTEHPVMVSLEAGFRLDL